jgi:glutathione S-transferase
MKLRFSPTSPYVRKVAVTAIEAGLDERIERVPTDVWAADSDIGDDNPLGKVPALALDDGLVLCDSPLICEYLSAHATAPGLIPAEGAERWQALNFEALGDGIMDAAVARVIETMKRPAELRWDDWLSRQAAKIGRALDALERSAIAGKLGVPHLGATTDIGRISIACALGYLDFRFPDDDWRQNRPSLAAWYEGYAARPAMQATEPPG